MKNLFMFLLGLTFTCTQVYGNSVTGKIYRCENDEVVCYKTSNDQTLQCKFKS